MIEPDLLATWAAIDNNIIQLWAMFVAGNFAVVAFILTRRDHSTIERVAVTIGFWLYAIGNLILILQRVYLNLQIYDVLQAGKDPQAAALIYYATNPMWKSVVFHVLVSICVTVLIWRRNPGNARGT